MHSKLLVTGAVIPTNNNSEVVSSAPQLKSYNTKHYSFIFTNIVL